MQHLILKIFLFALINVILVLVHFWLFNKQPIIGYTTAIIHIILLIIFPYRKLFKPTN